MILRRAVPLMLGLIVACDSGSTPADSGTGSGGMGESSSSTGGSSSSTGEDSSSTSGAALCGPFADESPAPDSVTTIEFRNNSSQSFLLPTGCGLDFLSISSEDGSVWPGPYCSGTCADQFENGCSACEPCATTSFRVLASGATTTIEWAGDLYAEAGTLPPECVGPEGLCGSSCSVQRDAAAFGTIDIQISGLTQAECEAVATEPQYCVCPAGLVCSLDVDDGSGQGPQPTTSYSTPAAPGSTVVLEAVD